MAKGGKRINSGRKSNMDKNGYWNWLQNVLVAYLVSPHETIEIEGPVKVYATRNDVLLSLIDVATVFGRPGAEHFKSWFYVKEQGKPGSGLSHCVVHSDFKIHDAIFDYLEQHKLVELVEQPLHQTRAMASFVKSVRARRAFNEAGKNLDPAALGEAYPFVLQRERMKALRSALDA